MYIRYAQQNQSRLQLKFRRRRAYQSIHKIYIRMEKLNSSYYILVKNMRIRTTFIKYPSVCRVRVNFIPQRLQKKRKKSCSFFCWIFIFSFFLILFLACFFNAHDSRDSEQIPEKSVHEFYIVKQHCRIHTNEYNNRQKI